MVCLFELLVVFPSFCCILCDGVFYFSKVDEYGFERGDDFDTESYGEFLASYLKVLARRSKRWYDSYPSGNKSWERSPTLKRFVRKGIPAEYRAKVCANSSLPQFHQVVIGVADNKWRC